MSSLHFSSTASWHATDTGNQNEVAAKMGWHIRDCVEFDATVIAFAPGNNRSILDHEPDGVAYIQSKGVAL